MDDPRNLHRQAGEMTARTIDRIEPGQMGLPTPCTDWTVRDLINHVVNGNIRFAALCKGVPGPVRGANVLGPDPAADFRSSLERICAIFDEAGFLERTVPTPIGDGPGHLLVAMRVTELTTHSWDLATATGQPRDLEPDLVAFATALLRSRPTPRVNGGPLGPEQEAPPGASPADRLAALAGRAVPAAG